MELSVHLGLSFTRLPRSPAEISVIAHGVHSKTNTYQHNEQRISLKHLKIPREPSNKSIHWFPYFQHTRDARRERGSSPEKIVQRNSGRPRNKFASRYTQLKSELCSTSSEQLPPPKNPFSIITQADAFEVLRDREPPSFPTARPGSLITGGYRRVPVNAAAIRLPDENPSPDASRIRVHASLDPTRTRDCDTRRIVLENCSRGCHESQIAVII